MLFRKVIYIGESEGQAIYVHVDEPRNPLAAPKSSLLNTAGARDTNSFIPELVVLFLAKWKENFFLIK